MEKSKFSTLPGLELQPLCEKRVLRSIFGPKQDISDGIVDKSI
jgi:hypothetical protein